MYKTAGFYTTRPERLNHTVFCGKSEKLQEPQPLSNVVSCVQSNGDLGEHMKKHHWPESPRWQLCVCVCVRKRFPLQFSSVVLIQRITADWTALSWTLPLQPSRHTLCILHPYSLSRSLSISTLALLLLLLLPLACFPRTLCFPLSLCFLLHRG